MGAPTPEDLLAIRGEIVIKCVKAGGYTMTNYGAYAWSQDEQKSLFDVALPATLRVLDYKTAKRMINDLNYELAQRIAAGDFIIITDTPEDLDRML